MPFNNSLSLTSVPSRSRNSSPMALTPSPSREIRGIRLFRAISRKISRRSDEHLHSLADSDGRSSSSDSDSGSNRSPRLKAGSGSGDSGFRSVSPNQMSSSSSSSSVSDSHRRPRHHHSTSAESVRNVFQHLNLNSRSQSCANAKENRKSSKPPPKRILRQPTAYTYVKGLSGLPTQRVPRTRKATSPCGCGMQFMTGLNR